MEVTILVPSHALASLAILYSSLPSGALHEYMPSNKPLHHTICNCSCCTQQQLPELPVPQSAAELTLLNPPIHWHSTLSSHTTFILFHELQITAVKDI
jgi:hypothetical protein